jgi:beta-lactamase superfamily II metal-dependent hydrolase
MFELDFLPVGDGERSGDAIALRYSHPETGELVTGIIDTGFEDDGGALVGHFHDYYGTNRADFVLITHPDSDHINGAGTVLRELDVGALLIHRPSLHGYDANSGARPAEELARLAVAQGSQVLEPFVGVHGFGGSLLVAGPSVRYYEEQLQAQRTSTKLEAPRRSFAERYFGEAGRSAVAVLQRALASFPVELPFDDAGGTNPRNNSAAIVSLLIDGKHFLLPSDTGVPALTQALDYLDGVGRTAHPLRVLALPHHGSRHNIDRDTIHRLLGSPGSAGIAVASVSSEAPKHPSPRVANAAGRRGYPVFRTAGKTLTYGEGFGARPGWGPAPPLPPLVEDDHED